MTISRNEFIAETAARFYATRSTGAPFELRGFSIQAFNAAHGEAEAFAQELERENCAPWANYDLIVSHGRQEAIDAAVTKERERCAQAVEAWGATLADSGYQVAARLCARDLRRGSP